MNKDYLFKVTKEIFISYWQTILEVVTFWKFHIMANVLFV